MNDVFREINNKLHLKFGELPLSPLAALNVALVYEHIENFLKSKVRRPMFISLPTIEGIGALLPASVLINMFFEDYIYRSDQLEEDLALKRGDLVEIFQTAAVFNKLDDKLELSFLDGGRYHFNRRYINFIEKTSKKMPNKYGLFSEKRRKFLRNPDALSKILEPAGNMPIPKASLKSKVMIVAGRGNMGRIRSSLSSFHIYGEPFNKIVMEDDQLIIKQDLEEFINLASGEDEKAGRKFENYFLLLTSKFKSSELEECEGLEEIKQAISEKRTMHRNFKSLFEDFIEGLEEDGNLYRAFLSLKKHLPVPTAVLPLGLRAVFICDIKLYERYENTIGFLMKKGIPVICLVDKLIEAREDLDFFSNFFAVRHDSIRLNWTRELIFAMDNEAKHTRYLDHHFWRLAKRYANQRIELKVYDDDGLEEVFEMASQAIKALESHEILIDSFWKWLFPAWYIVKNSFGKGPIPYSLLDEFDDATRIFQYLLPKEVSELSFRLRFYDFNQKVSQGRSIYVQNIMVRDKGVFTVPIVTPTYESEVEGSLREICFSGFPYRELNHRPLWRAVFEDFIPKVYMALWPNEAKMTYNYLRTRIVKSEMTIHLDADSKLQAQIFPAFSKDNEADERIFYTFSGIIKTVSQDDPQVEKMESIHGRNLYTNNTQLGYQLLCDILYFEEELMYLPHNASIYHLVDSGYGNVRLERCEFDNLRRGSLIVQFSLSRHDLRTYAKSDPQYLNLFQIVDQWRELVRYLFNNYDNDLNSVLKYVEGVSGSVEGLGTPSKHNLQRWRYDEDMIAPEYANLKLLAFCAGSYGGEIDVEAIAKAAQTLRTFSRKINTEVKDLVQNWVNSSGRLPEGIVFVRGVPVNVVTKKIQGLEKSDMLVNYSDTRKILR